MNEETEKKTENREKPVNQQVISSNGGCRDCRDLGGLRIEKSLQYETKKETPKERKKRIDNWETAKRKKIWLKTYFNHVGNSYETICSKTGIPRRTFDYWKQNDLKFRDAIFEKKENRVEIWEDRVISEGMKGNVPALKFLLENNHPTYSKKLRVETYTGDKTLEDLIAEDEKAVDEHNKKVDELNKEKIQGQSVVHSEHPEDKKQEGEDSPISA